MPPRLDPQKGPPGGLGPAKVSRSPAGSVGEPNASKKSSTSPWCAVGISAGLRVVFRRVNRGLRSARTDRDDRLSLYSRSRRNPKPCARCDVVDGALTAIGEPGVEIG